MSTKIEKHTVDGVAVTILPSEMWSNCYDVALNNSKRTNPKSKKIKHTSQNLMEYRPGLVRVLELMYITDLKGWFIRNLLTDAEDGPFKSFESAKLAAIGHAVEQYRNPKDFHRVT